MLESKSGVRSDSDGCLCNQLLHHLRALVVREARGEAVALVGELGVVEAEELQQRGVIIEVLHFVDDGLVAEFNLMKKI